MNQPRFLSKKDFAAHRGVGKSAVSNWVKRGWIVEAEDPEDGVVKVDVARTVLKLNAHLDPARGRPKAADSLPQGDLPLAPAPIRGEPAGASMAEVRTDLIRVQTVKVQLENAKRAGELVLLEDYARRASEFGRVARERMLSIVRSQAEWLAACKDTRSVVAHLEEEIERAFADLAAQIVSGEVVEAEAADDVDDAAVAAEVEAALADGEEQAEVG